MGPIEALEFALNKEIEARRLYEDFSIKYPLIKDTCVFLANQEEKHKDLIERKIAELINQ